MKFKYHSNFGVLKKLPNLLEKKINFCGFFNGNMNGVLYEKEYTLLGYQGREFIIGYIDIDFYGKEKSGEFIVIKTNKGKSLSYEMAIIDEKSFSYRSFHTRCEYHTVGYEDIYPNTSKSLINIQSHTLKKIDLYGIDAKRIVPEFPDEPDSTPYDIDLKFIHSVAFHFDQDLVLFLDIDYEDSKINYMDLYLLTNDGFAKEILNDRLLVKDDWGYLRYNLLFSYGDK